MDRLTAFVALAHAQLRIEYLKKHPEILEGIDMTPNIKGLGSALAKLKHDLDLQAAGALTELSSLGERANVAMGKAKQKIAETKASVEEIEAFVADEGGNGGPTLSDSSGTSGQSPAAPAAQALAEPAASWKAQ
jgi:hypothetical protein